MQYNIVDISGLKISTDPKEMLVTFSLGSCLGVAVFDPVAQVAGMLHCMLPLAKLDRQKAESTPGMFVDSGVPALFNEMFQYGARKSQMRVTISGAARVLQGQDHFRIGERNVEVCRRILEKNRIPIYLDKTGGEQCRTIFLDVGTGQFTVRCGGQETVYDLSG